MSNRNFRDQAYRDRAKALRDQGISTPHVSHKRMWRAMQNARNANVGPGTWEHVMREARLRWQNARTDAVEQYRFAVFGDQWEGMEL
jgi:hypothetical protein